MPDYYYRGRRDEIINVVGVEDVNPAYVILFFVLVTPIAIVLTIVVSIADFIASHFVLSSIIYYSAALLASIILGRIKKLHSTKMIFDVLGNLAVFSTFYIISFIYYIPVILKHLGEGFFGKIVELFIVSFILLATIFMQQCIRGIIDKAYVNLLLSFLFLALFIWAFKSIIVSDDFNESVIIEVYKFKNSELIHKILASIL